MTANKKFNEPTVTSKGEARAFIKATQLENLWFNTGTQCNLACENCYIESNPKNDRLAYITAQEIEPFLDEIVSESLKTKRISLTGGEPFMNPHIIEIIELVLSRGFELLILTNAYKVINRYRDRLTALNDQYKNKLFIRVSLDHYTQKIHEQERGPATFNGSLEEIKKLCSLGYQLSIAGRALIDEKNAIEGYQQLMVDQNIPLTLDDSNLVIFPEMEAKKDLPEITTKCWGILGINPKDIMCSTERMIVKRKEHKKPTVLACTLIAYDKQFETGLTLKDSLAAKVYLNHPYCSEFCVLGGASCSSAS